AAPTAGETGERGAAGLRGGPPHGWGRRARPRGGAPAAVVRGRPAAHGPETPLLLPTSGQGSARPPGRGAARSPQPAASAPAHHPISRHRQGPPRPGAVPSRARSAPRPAGPRAAGHRPDGDEHRHADREEPPGQPRRPGPPPLLRAAAPRPNTPAPAPRRPRRLAAVPLPRPHRLLPGRDAL